MRKKVGFIVTLTKERAAELDGGRGILDGMIFENAEARVQHFVWEQRGQLCGKLLRLREEYPNPHTSRSRAGEMLVDWRVWGFAEIPEISDRERAADDAMTDAERHDQCSCHPGGDHDERVPRWGL